MLKNLGQVSPYTAVTPALKCAGSYTPAGVNFRSIASAAATRDSTSTSFPFSSTGLFWYKVISLGRLFT